MAEESDARAWNVPTNISGDRTVKTRNKIDTRRQAVRQRSTREDLEPNKFIKSLLSSSANIAIVRDVTSLDDQRQNGAACAMGGGAALRAVAHVARRPWLATRNVVTSNSCGFLALLVPVAGTP